MNRGLNSKAKKKRPVKFAWKTKTNTNVTKRDVTHMRFMCKVVYSERGSKNTNPEFSRISGGGSTSTMSIFSMDFDISSTENGMLQHKKIQVSAY